MVKTVYNNHMQEENPKVFDLQITLGNVLYCLSFFFPLIMSSFLDTSAGVQAVFYAAGGLLVLACLVSTWQDRKTGKPFLKLSLLYLILMGMIYVVVTPVCMAAVRAPVLPYLTR
jgi:hypothetical protein